MPELAEVEYYRKQWDPGLGSRVLRVALHGEKRIFRGFDPAAISTALTGATLQSSETRGKQMVFRFSRGGWLGLHMGMTGSLKVETRQYEPGKHDHLVLFQRERTLVFSDPRQFGRVRFHTGKGVPPWWSDLPPEVDSKEFTRALLGTILQRRGRAPVKAVLLMQEFFPGVGNWMADEILWQAGLNPRTLAGNLNEPQQKQLWSSARNVCRIAMKTIGRKWGDPPADWLFHERWSKTGHCPRHGTPLERAAVGGRTTVWCARCQPDEARSQRKTG